MLFNSVSFIFAFLPLVVLVYYGLISRGKQQTSQFWLVLASLYFYSYWEQKYLLLIILSLLVNFLLGKIIYSLDKTRGKRITFLGITLNVLLLGYFKYSNFFVDNLNYIIKTSINLENIVLPLAISFFTFQQIAYLVDCYKKDSREYNFLQYSLFVTFFPQLIAGPIVHHKEMMPQFSITNSRFNSRNFYIGLSLFSIGLFKKTVIADTFAIYANAGFDGEIALDFYSAWISSLSYTFQLYFDFSGYCDMAMGLALLFNIKLPINFNSPYKSSNIQEFWRRWHITLGRFLRDYIYIPLGGNKGKKYTTLFNLFFTFLIGGIWHGASWMFIIWGAMHGLALVFHRVWNELGFKLNRSCGWLITFMFVNITWVFFRASDIDVAFDMLSHMFSFDMDTMLYPTFYFAWLGTFPDIIGFSFAGYAIPFAVIVIFLVVVTKTKNAYELVIDNSLNVFLVSVLYFFSLVFMMSSIESTFLYFNF